MINTIINTLNYNEPSYDYNAILKYAGVQETSCRIDNLIDSCIDEIKDCLVYKICYKEFPFNSSNYNNWFSSFLVYWIYSSGVHNPDGSFWLANLLSNPYFNS
jgi:hypothetical protein